MPDTVERSARQAADAAHGAADSTPMRVGVRIGLVSYGITHILIAWLALQVAFGAGSNQASQSGAFQELARQPLGWVLLWVLVVGFAAIAIWRLAQAIWGFRYISDRFTNLRRRASSAAKVVVFVALAFLAASTAAGGGGGGQQNATAGALGLPGGQYIVGAVGLGIVAAGVAKIVAGWRSTFRGDMDLPADRTARRIAIRTGQVGFVAKGVSVTLIGVFVVVAAVRFRPDEASGLDAALKGIAAQPFGPYLLGLVALGLAAYGVFCFFDARYHRI